jgi:hypothetical protein
VSLRIRLSIRSNSRSCVVPPPPGRGPSRSRASEDSVFASYLGVGFPTILTSGQSGPVVAFVRDQFAIQKQVAEFVGTELGGGGNGRRPIRAAILPIGAFNRAGIRGGVASHRPTVIPFLRQFLPITTRPTILSFGQRSSPKPLHVPFRNPSIPKS